MIRNTKRLLQRLNAIWTIPIKYSDKLFRCFSSVWCVSPLLLLGQLELFFNDLTMKYAIETGVGMSDWCLSEQVLADDGVYWLLWKPRTSSIGRCGRYSTGAPRWLSKWPAKWTHFASLFCLLLLWRPPRQYGASSCLMAASSGFRCSPGHAALGYAACIASTPHHGHRNGPQRRGIRSPPPPISLGIIVVKDHVRVH